VIERDDDTVINLRARDERCVELEDDFTRETSAFRLSLIGTPDTSVIEVDIVDGVAR